MDGSHLLIGWSGHPTSEVPYYQLTPTTMHHLHYEMNIGRLHISLLLASMLLAARAQVRVPPYFNVALNKRIWATSTCGQTAEGTAVREQYCQLTLTREADETTCGFCDASRSDGRHPIQFAVDGSENRWQSPPLSRGEAFHEVNVTVALGQEFQVAYVVIQAGNAPLPGYWALERSMDDVTYTPWQYFVENEDDCENLYGISLPQTLSDDTVICTARYSQPVPLSDGEIFVSLINGRPGADSYSPALQAWTRAAYIRLRLMRVITLYGDLLTQDAYNDQTLTRRYFYSIKEIIVGGHCTCNGHSEECPQPDLQCVCLHGTCGMSCGECCEGYNQYKWQARSAENEFSCEKCNCHGHSSDCIYNSTVDRLSLSLNLAGEHKGGGVCQSCANHTAGINCEVCELGYYRTPEMTKQDSCSKCNCSGLGILDGSCDGNRNAQCICKKNVEGFYCDRCKPGYFRLDANNPEGCTPCECNEDGKMVGMTECNEEKTCACKSLVSTPNCGGCVDGTYGLSVDNFFGCQLCECDIGGSSQPFDCNKGKGKCECHPGMRGKRCNSPLEGTCLPTLHTTLRFEAEDGMWSFFRTPFAFNESEFPSFTSFGYVVLRGLSQESIEVTASISKDGKYRVVIHYVLQSEFDDKATVSVNQRDVSSSMQSQDIVVSKGEYASTGEFVLTAGAWQIEVMYTGVNRLLIDHVILLPELYYNPTMLYSMVSEMCPLGKDTYLCRNYSYPSLASFPGKSVPDTILTPYNLHEKVVFPISSSRSISLVFNSLSTDSNYTLVVSYFNQLSRTQRLQVVVQSDVVESFDINLLPCMYDFGCRQVGTRSGDVAHFGVRGRGNATVTISLPVGATVGDMSLFIESVFLVPVASWNPILMTPAFYCYQLSGSCIQTEFPSLSGPNNINSFIADEGYFFDSSGNRQDVPVSTDPDLNRHVGSTHGAAKLSIEHQVVYMDVSIPEPSDYYGVIHYYNPGHSSVTIEIDVNGAPWHLQLPFCPDKSGCRIATTSHRYVDDPMTLEVELMDMETLYVFSVALVSSTGFSSSEYTSRLPVNLNARYVNECSSNGYLITLRGSAPFCVVSARSLSAQYHRGSVNCSCHPGGSYSPECDSNTCGCRCKDNIVGDRCTQCKVGYYGFPNCHPCQCADGSVCDDVTGRCICPPNVRGDKCDRCKNNYWAFHAVSGCVPCGCDTVGSLTLRCNKRTGECPCKANFTGNKCDSCIDGKYNPPDCDDCNCDPKGSVSMKCRQSTGQCQCRSNMGGRACDRCRVGAFNYTESNPDGCEPCGCDTLGSVGPACHQTTGQCACKRNVTGLKCDRCDPDSYRLVDGSCAACNCHPEGSKSQTCNIRTGKCPCRKFVRGRQCVLCSKGYYGLGTSGCIACGCNEFGSQSSQCDAVTGQCNCKGVAYGKQCDLCAPRHILSQDGCRPCGLCTDTVMDEFDGLIRDMNSTLSNVSDYSIVVAARDKLNAITKRYNETNAELLIIVENLNATDLLVGLFFGTLGQSQASGDQDDAEINATVQRAVEMFRNATGTFAAARDLLAASRAVNRELKRVTDALRVMVMQMDESIANNSEVIAEATRIKNDIDNRDFSEVEKTVETMRMEAMETRGIVKMRQNETRAYVERAEAMQGELNETIRMLIEALEMGRNVGMTVNMANERVRSVDERLGALMTHVAMLQSHVQTLERNISETSALIKRASGVMRNASAAYHAASRTKNVLHKEKLTAEHDLYAYRQSLARAEVNVTLATVHANGFRRQATSIRTMSEGLSSEAQGPVSRYRAMDFPNVTDLAVNVTLHVQRTAVPDFGVNNSAFDAILASAILSHEDSSNLLKQGQRSETELHGIQDSLNSVISNISRLKTDGVSHNNTLQSAIQTLDEADGTVTNVDKGVMNLEKNITVLERRLNESVEEVYQAKQNVSRAEMELRQLVDAVAEADVKGTEDTVRSVNSRLRKMRKQTNEKQAAFDQADTSLDALENHLDRISANIKLALENAKRVNLPISAGSKGDVEQAVAVALPKRVVVPAALTTVSLTVRRMSDVGLLFYMGELQPVTSRRRREVSDQQDFVAIELQGGVPVVMMSIGNVFTAIHMTKQMIARNWYKIDVHRLGKIVTFTMNNLDSQSGALGEITSSNIDTSTYFLNIGPKGQVLVGGIPSDSEVLGNVTRKGFDGCIDNVLVNSVEVPLFAFAKAEHMTVSTCNATNRKSIQTFNDGMFFTGFGYIALQNSVLTEDETTLTLRFRHLATFQLDGLLFFASGMDGKFLSLEVRNGSLLAQFNNGGQTVSAILEGLSLIKHTGIIDLKQDSKKITLLQRGSGRSVESSMSSVTAMIAFTSPAFFGGVSDNIKLPAGVGHRALRACVASIDNIDFTDKSLYEAESMSYNPTKCPVETIACATFDGSGHVVFEDVGLLKANNTYVSIYPNDDTGVIVFEGSETADSSYAYLAIVGGQVEFVWYHTGGDINRVVGGVVPVDEWSHIAVILEEGKRVHLTVNGNTSTSSATFTSSSTTSNLFIGGVSSPISTNLPTLETSGFSGSVSGVIANGRNVNFANLKDITSTTIALGQCPDVAVTSTPPTEGPVECAAPPKVIADAFYFDGMVGSRMEFQHGDNSVIKRRFKIQLELRTFADNGLVLFAGNSNLQSYLYLRLTNGKLEFGFSASGTRTSIQSAKSVHRGKWHTIVISRDGKKGQLSVDGRMKGLKLDNATKVFMPITTPFFVGHVAKNVRLNKIRKLAGIEPFQGCIRNLEVENNTKNTIMAVDWQSARSFGSPDSKKCYQKIEQAAGFDGESYAIVGESWTVQMPFTFTVDIRTTNMSGLLLSISEKKKYVAVYIKAGTVTFEVAKGKSKKSRALLTNQRSVCDGKWHKVNAVVDNTKLTLDIDGKKEETSLEDGRNTAIVDNATLYIGGVPGKKSRVVPVNNFVGCMQTDYVVDEGRTLMDATNAEDVNLNECPVP